MSSLKRKVRITTRRSTRGFSLVTVLLFGLIATMWLTATMTTLIPVYQKAAQQKYYGIARAAAEAATDYAIDNLNNAVAANQQLPTDISVPPAVLGNSLATANVIVKDVVPPSTSYLYDPTLVPKTGPSDPNQFSIVSSNAWRMLETTAIVAGATKRVRAIIRPEYVLLPSSNPPSNPAFKYSLYAATNVTLNPNSSTDGYDSSQGAYTPYDPMNPNSANRFYDMANPARGLGGDVGSFSSVNLGKGVTVGGQVDVTLQPAGSQSKTAFATDNSSVVNRYVTLNGTQNGNFADSGSSANVFSSFNSNMGFGNDIANGSRSQAILESQSVSQLNLPPTPPAPPNFVDGSPSSGSPVDLGAVNLTSSSTTTILVTSTAPPPPYVITPGMTNKIQPGNYTADSLAISNTSQITVNDNSQPFRLFLKGSTEGPNAVDITGTGNGLLNMGAPSNVQIYYNGSKNINLLNNKGMSAVVYAPNAAVNLTPSVSGTQVDYFGSFLGKTVNAQNAYVHFDRALSNGAYSAALSNAYANNASSGLKQRKYIMVSWQEF